MKRTNPVINSDFPDPDIIRVEDTYYMASTTMHYMPGCDILRSFDLMNWEFVTHAYETLAENEAYQLANEKEAYGKGMWAPSFCFHNGTFYITFTSNDLQKTILLTSQNIEKEWMKSEIEGFFYDGSLFFDDDEKVYMVHGQGILYVTELERDLSKAKENGLHRVIVKDQEGIPLGYEGSHLYKKDGFYYLFTCHFLKNSWKTQDYFVSESLEKEFLGGCLIDDNMDYRKYGVAQGGIVDTPDGDWYCFMFQDRGALGRAPVIMPLSFVNGIPVVGEKVVKYLQIPSTRPEHHYNLLNGDDNFHYESNNNGCYLLKPWWQFNHNPDWDFISFQKKENTLSLMTNTCSSNLVFAKNTLTQRCTGPVSSATVTVDGTQMNEGDLAGISAFIGCYGAIALGKDQNGYYLSMFARVASDSSVFGDFAYTQEPTEYERIRISRPVARLKVVTYFSDHEDMAEFYIEEENGNLRQLGVSHPLYFKMDFFTGCRFGLFYFSRQQAGGRADFTKFRYQDHK